MGLMGNSSEARKHIDVLFTDIQLGGAVDGWDVGLKFRKVLPQIPVIYTSGTALRSERAVPTSLFVPKPYEPDVVVKSLSDFTAEMRLIDRPK